MQDEFERLRFDEPDDWEADPSIALPTAFPGIILAAGILWILSGLAYIGLFGICRLLQMPFSTSEWWLVAGAAFFVHDGIQLIRGHFRDPLADGIITILIGLFFIGSCFFGNGLGPHVIRIAFYGFFGLVFLVPGILVLIGRKQYLNWKMEHGR